MTQPLAGAFAMAFVEARKPIAAIRHVWWTWIEAGVVAGQTRTS